MSRANGRSDGTAGNPQPAQSAFNIWKLVLDEVSASNWCTYGKNAVSPADSAAAFEIIHLSVMVYLPRKAQPPRQRPTIGMQTPEQHIALLAHRWH